MPARGVGPYAAVQIAGGVAGAFLANLMFDRRVFELATKERITTGHTRREVVATAGLIALIFALARTSRAGLSRGNCGGRLHRCGVLVHQFRIDRARVGIFFGSGTGDLLRNEAFYRTWLTSGIERARPSEAWNHFTSTPVDAVAARFGFEGPRACVVAACASSAIAIGRAVEAIRRGRADVALAGGTDALARLTFTGFNLLRLMDPEPCRPFDRSRAGMNIGEGAGILVLEDLEHARRRGATILAEVAGHSLLCEAFHPTAPEPEGRSVASLVQLALEDARLDVAAVDHINAHGTATPQNDAAESRGFQRVLGIASAACRSRRSSRWSVTASARRVRLRRP